MSYEHKILFILLTMTFTLPLLIFDGSIDDFAPKHVMIINDLSENSFIPEENYNIQVPGFYVLGAILKQVSNISTDGLLFYPIQFIPYIVVFFALIYKLSNSYIFSGFLTFIEFISGATGTTKVFFWVHGIGSILFYLAIIILLNLMRENITKKPEFILLLIIFGSSLVFISYDLFAMLLIFLIILFIVSSAFKIIQPNFINYTFKFGDLSKYFGNICLILLVIEFGLSKFIYKSVIPTLKQSQYLELSSVDKFLVSYLHRQTETSLGDFVVSFPSFISIISALKYLVLLSSIFIFLFMIYKKIVQKKPINQFDLVTGVFILMTGVYGSTRLYIGGVIITLLYLPGIICTIWLYRFSEKYKNWATFVLLLLLVLVPIYEFTLYHSNLTNRDENKFSYVNSPATWYFDHTSHSIAISDELTKNLFLLHFYNTHDFNNREAYNSTHLLLSKDVLFLMKRSTPPEKDSKKYYIINYQLNAISLENWIIINSWRHYKTQLEENHAINKIYEVNHISIFY
jgi:hypothetical protein